MLPLSLGSLLVCVCVCLSYGRADQEGAFDYLIKWSPLHNIPSECSKYPATLLMTGEYDDRVSPLHSFKFGAALQHALPQNPNREQNSVL